MSHTSHTLREGGGGRGRGGAVTDSAIKIVRILDLTSDDWLYTDVRVLLIQWIADLSNIFAQIVDFACNLVRILDCDFIVELLANSGSKFRQEHCRIGGFCFKFGRICRFVYPYLTPHPPPPQWVLPEKSTSILHNYSKGFSKRKISSENCIHL